MNRILHAEQLKHTETLASMSYWTFNDIFEESGPSATPFEGGFGLINLEGIKKQAFFAYSFLIQLGDEELVDLNDRSWAARDKSGGVQSLLWDGTWHANFPVREDDGILVELKPSDTL